MVFGIACSGGPLALANIQIGRSLNQDRSVASITTLFKPNETVYVAVQTSAAGKGTISVKWKFGTQVIDEPTKQVDYDGPASTEFHLHELGWISAGRLQRRCFYRRRARSARARSRSASSNRKVRLKADTTRFLCCSRL